MFTSNWPSPFIRLQLQLEALGLGTVPVPGDGDCWYQSSAILLNHRLREPVWTALGVRLETAVYLIDHWIDNPAIIDPTSMLMQIIQPFCTAGDEEVCLTGNAFGYTIVLAETGLEFRLAANPDDPKDTWIIAHKQNHFEPVLQAKDVEVSILLFNSFCLGCPSKRTS